MKEEFLVDDGILIKYNGHDDEITVPDTVRVIGKEAFCDHYNLSRITLPDGIMEIRESAFRGCIELESINIPETVTVIGTAAFKWCLCLKEVHFPDGIKSVGREAFDCCRQMQEITLPRGISSFGGTVLEDIWNSFFDTDSRIAMISAFLRFASDSVIYDHAVIRKIRANRNKIIIYAISKDFPEVLHRLIPMLNKITLYELDEYLDLAKNAPSCMAILLDYKNKTYSVSAQAKFEAERLDKELGLKERSVMEWRRIFRFKKTAEGIVITGYKKSDHDVIIPDRIGRSTVVAIGDKAFFPGLVFDDRRIDIEPKIRHVSIPDSVKRIGSAAFEGCTYLSKVLLPSHPVELGDRAFHGCYELADSDGFLVVGDTLFGYRGDKERVEIPKGVKTISKDCFTEPDHITSVYIPDGVTHIEESAFENCSRLRELRLPDSVTYLGDRALYGCRGLADDKGFVIARGKLFGYYGTEAVVTVPEGVRSIGYRTFYNCFRVRKIILPESVEIIEADAFRSCIFLTDVVMSSNVKGLGARVFGRCGSLKGIDLPDRIQIGKDAFKCCPGLKKAMARRYPEASDDKRPSLTRRKK